MEEFQFLAAHHFLFGHTVSGAKVGVSFKDSLELGALVETNGHNGAFLQNRIRSVFSSKIFCAFNVKHLFVDSSSRVPVIGLERLG